MEHLYTMESIEYNNKPQTLKQPLQYKTEVLSDIANWIKPLK